MNHMNMSPEMHMDMPGMGPICGASAGGASDYLFYLGLFFFAGALFYLFRLAFRGYLKQVNGYVDPENEFWHGVCMIAMTSMLAPKLVSLFTPAVFLWALPVGVVWYLLRAFTYGKKLPYNKQWYDFAHAAMLFGMWWMFAEPVKSAFLSGAFAAYWGWFASYYLTRIVADCKKPHWLSFGQDIAHFVMAVVMILMTLMPAQFMVMG